MTSSISLGLEKCEIIEPFSESSLFSIKTHWVKKLTKVSSILRIRNEICEAARTYRNGCKEYANYDILFGKSKFVTYAQHRYFQSV